jgi:hypothetical protein
MYDWHSRTRCSRKLRIIAGDPPDSGTERIAPDIPASIISIANLSGWNSGSGAVNSTEMSARSIDIHECPTTRLISCFAFPPTQSPAEVVEFFRQYYGPTNRAFMSLNETDARQLRKELEALWSAHNRTGDQLTIVQAEYLEVVATRA